MEAAVTRRSPMIKELSATRDREHLLLAEFEVVMVVVPLVWRCSRCRASRQAPSGFRRAGDALAAATPRVRPASHPGDNVIMRRFDDETM